MKKADRRWLVWALAAYAVLSLGSMFTMGIGAALVGVALLFALGGPPGLLSAIQSMGKVVAYRRYATVAFALLAALAVSLLAAEISPLHYAGRFSQVHALRDLSKAWYLLWPLLLGAALASVGADGRRVVLRAWLVAFAALAALAVLQHFTGFPRPQSIPGTERFHATLFLGHHLSVASVFIFPFFAALDLFSRKDAAKRTGLPREALGAAAALGLICLFLTYSRMLWIALPVGVLAWLLWAMPRGKRAWLAVAVAIGAGAVLFHPSVSKHLKDPRGILDRQHLWEANFQFFRERPLTGAGWHHNQELSGYYLMEKLHRGDVFSGHAHNNLLDLLGGTGALGTLAWLAWCILIFRVLIPQAGKATGFARGLVCAWIVFHINGLTQVNFWEAKVLHQMAWAVSWSLAWAAEARGGKA